MENQPKLQLTYRKDFTPEERALYNAYNSAYMREYRKRDDVKQKNTLYKREYRARKRLEQAQQIQQQAF